MNVSRVLFGAVVLASIALVPACRVSVETKTRYVENGVTVTPATWGGGMINIDIQGVGLAQGTSGITVSTNPDPNDKQVKATARMLAMAFGEEKSNADQSIIDAKATFTVTANGTGVDVKCGHGGTHGSSSAGESGCELVEVVVPQGSAVENEPKLHLRVLSGNGGMRLNLASAVISKVEGNSNLGDIEAVLPATKGGDIGLVAESPGDIIATLPATFAADSVILQGDPIGDDEPPVNKGPFTDIQDGGGRGTAGEGLVSLKLTAKGGTVTLKQ